jgi:hypothetical protein
VQDTVPADNVTACIGAKNRRPSLVLRLHSVSICLLILCAHNRLTNWFSAAAICADLFYPAGDRKTSCGAAAWCEEHTHLLRCHSILETISSPRQARERQARDRHRETQKEMRFSQERTLQAGSLQSKLLLY